MPNESPFGVRPPARPELPGIELPGPAARPTRPTSQGIASPAQGRSQITPLRRYLNEAYTGFYESAHSIGGPYPALLVQINQAGQTLVGWAVPPPIGIRIRPVGCFSPGSVQLSAKRWDERTVGVLFIASLDSAVGPTISLWSTPVALHTKWNAISDKWFLSADPTDVLARLRAGVPGDSMQLGELRLGSGDQPQLQIQFSDGAPGFEALTQVSDLPRIPGFYGEMTLGQSFTANPFHVWVTTHSRPLPTSYLDEEADRLAPNQPATSPLGDAIQVWQAAQDPQRSQLRAHVLKPLLSWLTATTPGPPAVYRGRAKAALFRALARNVVKATDSSGAPHSRYYREWVTLAYAEEYEAWQNHNRPANHPFVPAVADLGLQFGNYLYTFTFATGSLIPLPKWITGKIPEPGKYLRVKFPGGTAGFNPFYMDVKRELVTAVFDADGKPKIGSNGMIETSAKSKPEFDTSEDFMSGIVGCFLDVGVGFPKPGIDVKSVEILSYNGTLTKDSFNHASFELGQIKSPSIATPTGGAQGPASVIFAVNKDSDGETYDLMTVVEIPRSAALKKPSSTSDFFAPLLKPSKMLKPDGSLGSAGIGRGFFMTGPRGTREEKTVEPSARPAPPAEAVVRMDLEDFFEVDSHVIPATPGYLTALFSRRSILEASLAEYLSVIINPNAERDCIGWASPEGPADRNLTLSLRRAGALAQAYLDAFRPGTVAPIPDKYILGRGEAPSLEPPVVTNVPQLQDPETVIGMPATDPRFAAAYKKWTEDPANKRQIDTWPHWRKAQLRVNGQVIILVGGKQNP